jgi:molecular chaperone GrpE
VEALGKEFDPNFHEALGKKWDDSKKEMEILEVTMQGFTLNDRLLREAKVIVNQKEEEK